MNSSINRRLRHICVHGCQNKVSIRRIGQSMVHPSVGSKMFSSSARQTKQKLSHEFAQMSVLERIEFIHSLHGEQAIQVASMQKTSGVVMHHIFRSQVNLPILFVDTELHFKETQHIKQAYEEQYGLTIHSATPLLSVEQQAQKHGEELWSTVDGQQMCCTIRKEEPLLRSMKELDAKAMIKGLMRAEGGNRSMIDPISYDPRCDAIVYHPLFDWTREDCMKYIEEHDLPVNKLYTQQYRSIGCTPCTTPCAPGEDARAGRWRHLALSDTDDDGNVDLLNVPGNRKVKKVEYCGINFSDMESTNKFAPSPSSVKNLYTTNKTTTP